MYLSAYVTDKQTEVTTVIRSDFFNNKKEFANDLRSNGYVVTRISNRQDLAVQDKGEFANVGALKNQIKRFPYISEKEKIFLAEILKIEL